MLKLDSFKCSVCKLEFEALHGSDFNGDVKPVCECGSSDCEKVLSPIKMSSSDGMFHNKVPSGFKTILNEHARRAGSLNKIDTHLGEV